MTTINLIVQKLLWYAITVNHKVVRARLNVYSRIWFETRTTLFCSPHSKWNTAMCLAVFFHAQSSSCGGAEENMVFSYLLFHLYSCSRVPICVRIELNLRIRPFAAALKWFYGQQILLVCNFYTALSSDERFMRVSEQCGWTMLLTNDVCTAWAKKKCAFTCAARLALEFYYFSVIRSTALTR